MKNILFILTLFIVLPILSCSDKEDVMCTMEFRTVAITVNGTDLDQFYTLRELTGDTIRINSMNVPGDKMYPVLDDSFQQMIENKTEQFRFQGLINGVMVVNEPFVIKADKCHIEYVSGKTVIN